MTTRTDTTAAIATLLRYAERAGAPAEVVAHLWSIRGRDHGEQLRLLAELRAELAEVHKLATGLESQPLADVVPLFSSVATASLRAGC